MLPALTSRFARVLLATALTIQSFFSVATAAGVNGKMLDSDGRVAGAVDLDDECVSAWNESVCALSAMQLRGRLARAMQDDGISLPNITVSSKHAGRGGVTHVFAIGDWGSLLANHLPAPNSRPTRSHNYCPDHCHYVRGIDDRAQLLVAEQMKKRAATSHPQYILNVGDNFYWGGITQQCGGGTRVASGLTIREFAQVWQSVYGGLTNKPWISALGNHDYGGFQFNMGWDQQIAYSHMNHNWIMPARFFRQTMHHPGFTAEIFVIDSNAWNAKDPHEDPEHNICGATHNPSGATCAAVGGPSSIHDCKEWFWRSYNQQKSWLASKIARSRADWQIVVTHFPCGTDAGFYRGLHARGLDLLVTGHRHRQELHGSASPPCLVTGGGGGITSEGPPEGEFTREYGFFDLSLSKHSMEIELVNVHGKVVQTARIHPRR